LQQRLVRDKKLATALSVSYDPYNRGDSLFTISALPVNGVTLPELQKAIEQEIDLLKTELVNPKELERISTRFVANLIYGQDDIVGQAKLIGNLAVNGIDYRIMDQLPQRYEAITPEDIQRVSQTSFIKNNLSTLYLQPETQAEK
jgi:zinc protease